MRVLWLDDGWRGFAHWIANDPATALKIATLIDDTRRHPFTGLGKPEPLRGEYKGWWSRRITDEHRLIYRVTAPAPRRRSRSPSAVSLLMIL